MTLLVTQDNVFFFFFLLAQIEKFNENFNSKGNPNDNQPGRASATRVESRNNAHLRSIHPSDKLIAQPHLLVRATSEQFLPARATFRSVLTSESH